VPSAPLLVVQLDPSDPPARLGEWLRAAGLELDVRTLDAGDELPVDLGGHAGVVVLGGAQGANDNLPQLAAARALLRDAVSSQVPTLGICLGHQLLAAAHGGRVAPIPHGPEVGAQLVAKRTAAASDPLFGPLPITPDVLQWHFDEVQNLPAGAVQLASSPGCEQQAFRLGRLAWGVQFHIETTPDIVRSWARADEGELADYDLDAIVARVEELDEDMIEVWQPFAAAFAAVVGEPDAVPAPRGVPSSGAAPLTDPVAIRAALAAEADAARGLLPMPQLRRPDDG
jgi:GMP synthase (glutamine-hydrolysing)